MAHAAHLGGMAFGYLYLKGGGGGLSAEINYRYVKWKMNRLRRKFDVYPAAADPTGTARFTERRSATQA